VKIPKQVQWKQIYHAHWGRLKAIIKHPINISMHLLILQNRTPIKLD